MNWADFSIFFFQKGLRIFDGMMDIQRQFSLSRLSENMPPHPPFRTGSTDMRIFVTGIKMLTGHGA